MKDASKASSLAKNGARTKNNRARLERLLRQMLYSELAGSQANGFTKPPRDFVPYRRVIE
ncbi:hypothetical protein BH09VER1_BH09VER1_35040 [soil metagenome]